MEVDPAAYDDLMEDSVDQSFEGQDQPREGDSEYLGDYNQEQYEQYEQSDQYDQQEQYEQQEQDSQLQYEQQEEQQYEQQEQTIDYRGDYQDEMVDLRPADSYVNSGENYDEVQQNVEQNECYEPSEPVEVVVPTISPRNPPPRPSRSAPSVAAAANASAAGTSGKAHRGAPRLPPAPPTAIQTQESSEAGDTHARVVHRPPPIAGMNTSPRAALAGSDVGHNHHGGVFETPTKSDLFEFVPRVSPRPKATPPSSFRHNDEGASGEALSTPPRSEARLGAVTRSVEKGNHDPNLSSDDESNSPSSLKSTPASASGKQRPSLHKRIPRRDSFRFMNPKQQLEKKHSMNRRRSFHDTVYERTVVIDQGSYCVRAGFAGDELPVSQFRNVVCPKSGITVLYKNAVLVHLCCLAMLM
jgi:hypothetical protein